MKDRLQQIKSGWAVLFLVLLLIVLLIPAACAASGSDGTPQLTLATGGESGTYYPVGSAIAGIINDFTDDVEVTVVTSEGSVSNAGAIRDGQAELVLIENSIAYYASQGSQMFAGQPVSNIRGIATLYPETVQIIILKETGITALSDLQGKRVGVGAQGSGTAVNALAILAAAGLDATNLEIQYLDFNQCVAGLEAGTIDAGCVMAGIPTTAVTELAQAGEVVILSIPAEIYHQLSAEYPFYVQASIPAGTYQGVSQDIDSVAVQAMLAVSADLSDDVVYAMTRAIFEHTDLIVAAHPRGKDVTLASALDGMSLPLHSGAARYFSEKGLSLP